MLFLLIMSFRGMLFLLIMSFCGMLFLTYETDFILLLAVLENSVSSHAAFKVTSEF